MPSAIPIPDSQIPSNPPDLSHKLPKLTPRRRPQAERRPSNPPPPTPALPAPPKLDKHVYQHPSRRILSERDHKLFLESETHNLIVSFVFTLSDSVRDSTISDVESSPAAEDPAITALLAVLDEAEERVKRCPPIDTGSRFGNPAFRDFSPKWMKRCHHGTRSLVSRTTGQSMRSPHTLPNLLLSLLPDSTFPALVLMVFPRYLRVMRDVQSTYYLEPAGSHGVWGLDDYQFLPFLFGASQLVDHKHIRPLSIHNQMIVDECSKDYTYLDQIQWVNATKTVQGLRWHSPMLDDISSAKSWTKVDAGMRRMFLAEVLGKLPVAQHFVFGSLLPAAAGMSEDAESKVGEDDVGEVEVTVDDDADTSHNRRLKLKEPVDQLQLLVNQLVPDNREYAGSTGDGNDPLMKALEDLLPGIQDAAVVEGRSQAAAARQASDDNHDEAEAPMASEAAPLLKLLGEQIEGTQSDPLAAPPSTDRQARTPRHAQAVAAMLAIMPSQVEMDEIFRTRSSWWPRWRKSLDLTWGSAEADTLKSFAVYALAEADPCLLATVLIAFATATGERKRFLPAVELHIVNNDELSGTEHGLSCLMVLGLCYLNTLQPRRAWSVYRRANSLLLLNGIHLKHKGSAKRESIFWQLFSAERWVSLMVGLPYMVPDHLIDLSIAPVGELAASKFLYRHLAVLTGRVVDHISGARGPSFSSAIRVEEQMEDVLEQLPLGFLDIKSIRGCLGPEEQMMRLHRSVQYHQLRASLHMSFFLKTGSSERYDYGRRSCVTDSRHLAEAYLEIFSLDPEAASDGSILNFTAFTATVVVLLSALGYDRQYGQTVSTQLNDKDDWRLIYSVLDALKYGQQGIAGALCRQCRSALNTLIKSARTTGETESGSVVLPYFGTVSFKQKKPAGPPQPAGLEIGTPCRTQNVNGRTPNADLTGSSTSHMQLDTFQLDYYGPFANDGLLAGWPASEWTGMQASAASEQPCLQDVCVVFPVYHLELSR
ncbi:hypothetical protein B0A55_12080 [Friedmanniomyces simplex]|uniref:Serine/threonine-protein phosphatase 2A activator 2 n=1 Tax=Friedmanniomyces simplex TaxID=329884 RepID=A0A4U0WKP1_9PEZI|nr:hypothetical protein B0A55_12080 [Friedmanniomyces simplex]